MAEHNNDSSSKELLLKAAGEVFAERGYEGATVKHLADAAGVNVSLVSYYFGGKEGLYRACLEQFSHGRLETAERVLKSPLSSEDFRLRLQMFAEEFLRANMRDANVCKILNREMDSQMNPIAMDVFKKSFVTVFERFDAFIKGAQKQKIIRNDIDSKHVAVSVFGALVHFVRTDPLRKLLHNETITNEKTLETSVREVVTLWTEGLFTKKADHK
jgi:AcrR family transcriptional regulator